VFQGFRPLDPISQQALNQDHRAERAVPSLLPALVSVADDEIPDDTSPTPT
jgi:hypothetical protein